jgi:predicted TPR repeat methyltransferase
MNQIEAQAAFELAVEKQKQGHHDEAQSLYEQILSVHKNHHHALHLLGVIESTKGDQHLARRLMESSLWIAPDDPDVLANLAQVLFHLDLFEETLARCDQSLSLNDTNLRCHLIKARALGLLGRYTLALDALDILLKMQPTFAEAWYERAFCLHSLNQIDAALEAYDQVIALKADHARALNNRGHALLSLRRYEEAQQSVEAALQLSPQLAEAHYHLGLIHEQADRYIDALTCFQNTNQLNPTHSQALVHQAFAMQKLKRLPHACIAVLDRALGLEPNNLPMIAARGGMLMGLKQTEEALRDYQSALAINPSNPKFHTNCGEALVLLDRAEDAKQAFHRALELGGNASYLQYALASLGDYALPTAAPKQYVVDLFDGYAHRFDEHLQTALKYESPRLLTQIILAATDRQDLSVLDLGCGTGLCGPLLRPRAQTMVGVDLSPNMLEMAGLRACYDSLVCSDIVDFLQTQTAKFDCVISTDVFIYVGDLTETFAYTTAALNAGGLFAFTVESTDAADVELRSSRRFAHSKSYLLNLAEKHGYETVAMQPSVIRQEGGEDLHGFLVLLRLNAS